MFFKKLSVDTKIDNLSAPLGDRWGGGLQNFKMKVPHITYLWEGLFETKNFMKVVLTCDDY